MNNQRQNSSPLDTKILIIEKQILSVLGTWRVQNKKSDLDARLAFAMVFSIRFHNHHRIQFKN